MPAAPSVARQRARPWIAAAVGAVVLTMASTAVRSDVVVVREDIMGCETGCPVAAAGWPVAYAVDGRTSPVGSADLLGVLLGIDEVDRGALALTAAFWAAVSGALVALGAAGRRATATRRVA